MSTSTPSTTLIQPTLENKTASQAGAVPATGTNPVPEKRAAFFAPEGYRRLTINLPDDLHKQLRRVAVERDCTATEIIQQLLLKDLYK